MSTQQEIAAHLDLTDRQVRNLLDSGVLPSGPRGQLDLDGCRVAYIRSLRARARAERTEAPGSARDRLATTQALRVEIENENENDTRLIDADHVLQLFAAMAADLTSRFDALPGRVAHVLAGMTEPSEIRALLKSEMNRVREALTNLVERFQPKRRQRAVEPEGDEIAVRGFTPPSELKGAKH